MRPFPTPFRYPGGKTKLTPYVAEIFNENALLDGHYVEPYCGGAGLALSLLFKGYARYLHLNDLDRSIYAVWYSILNNTDELCRFVKDIPVTIDEWKKQEAIQAEKETIDLLTLGQSTLFLNRTNRSGVIRSGPIGGFDQTGNYKVDVRFKRNVLEEQIRKIAFYKRRITLTNLDAKFFLTNDVAELPQKTLVNLDPPYFVQGKELYKNSYTIEDHKEISTIVPNLEQMWIITYDNVDSIRDLYTQYDLIEYKVAYSVNKKYRGKEILIADPRLKLPPIELLQKAA